MKNIKLTYFLGILIVIHAILRALDGFTGGDVIAISIFVVFSLLFRLLSGIKNLNEIVQWGVRRRFRAIFFLFAIGSVGAQALWRAYAGEFGLGFAAATTIEAALIFATCLVFGVWLKDQTVRLLILAHLMPSKENNERDSKSGK